MMPSRSSRAEQMGNLFTACVIIAVVLTGAAALLAGIGWLGWHFAAWLAR